MNLEQIETWMINNGFKLKNGYWFKSGGKFHDIRYNICPKTLRLEFKHFYDGKWRWKRACSGYFSQLYIDKDGKLGGMR